MLPGAVTSNTMIGSSLSMQNVIAVESITLRPLLRISKWLTSMSFTAVGSSAGVGAVDAVDAGVRALQDRLGADLRRAQRGGGVGGEVRVAGAGREHDDPALLEVPDRAQRDERLGDLRHRDRGLHACRLADRLERVLQRERVDHGGEHAHVVGAGAVHAARRAGHAPPDVAAADDDRDLDAELAARASATSSAMRCTTAASMPKLVVVSANASPDSLRTTRRYWLSPGDRRLMASDASPRPPSRGRTA